MYDCLSENWYSWHTLILGHLMAYKICLEGSDDFMFAEMIK